MSTETPDDYGPEPRLKTQPQFEYTEAMRARALERIERRRQIVHDSVLFADYMATMFRAFRRRLLRELPSQRAEWIACLPDHPDIGVIHKAPAKKRRRRGAPPNPPTSNSL